MRIADPLLRQRLPAALRQAPRRTSSELAAELGISAQTVRRLLAELPLQSILTAGRTRRARYALRRALRGVTADVPLYAIGPSGQGQQIASLARVDPEGTLLSLDTTPWPVPAESRDGWWDGLPYPIFAIRPQGYLGRRFARAEHRGLGVSEDPEAWTDDDILWGLSRRGTDTVGNLILGSEAYVQWLQDKVNGAEAISAAALPDAYLDCAREAVALAGGGSSAAGEFPKFTAMREHEGAGTQHVLVKFSGASGSATEQRWADLLVCEHLALAQASQLPGIDAARSRILQHGGRVFIEVERFDRVGRHGRLSLCGLDAVQAAFIGSSSADWRVLVAQLHELGLVDESTVTAVQRLWWFGRQIANSDMHLGNLSFHVEGAFRLAPTYDMLPMGYAPLAGGEIPPRDFMPPLPLPGERPQWAEASTAAVAFWKAAAADARISCGFRSICRENASRLADIAGQV